MDNIINRFITDESGTGVVEAGIVVLVIAVVLMGAMTGPGENHPHQLGSAAAAP